MVNGPGRVLRSGFADLKRLTTASFLPGKPNMWGACLLTTLYVVDLCEIA
jgi:hypothetical protein